MTASWDDDYLTVNEIAERLQLNPQTLRNWIDRGELPAVRIGRRVRVRRADLDRILAEGSTVVDEPQAPAVGVTEAREQLTEALGRARRLLGHVSGARRAELAAGLQELTDSVAAALDMLTEEASTADEEAGRQKGRRGRGARAKEKERSNSRVAPKRANSRAGRG